MSERSEKRSSWSPSPGKIYDEIAHWIWSPPERSAPPVLYHYTDGGALLSMLRQKQIWLTNISCLNDPTEGRYGRIEFMKRWAKDSPEEYIDEIEANIMNGDGVLPPQFVFCTSEDPDSLDQWRAYGADGRGYCVGLRVREVSAHHFRKVKYGADSIDVAVSNFHKMFDAFRDGVFADGSKLDEEKIASVFAQYVGENVKHECYRSESEWRLCVESADRAKWNYRDGGFGITPYVVESLDRYFELESIVVGPKCPTESLVIAELIDGLSLDGGVFVSKSELPYR